MIDHSLIEEQFRRGRHLAGTQAGKLLQRLLDQRGLHQPATVQQA